MAADYSTAVVAITATTVNATINWFDVFGDGITLLTAIATFILIVTLIRKHLIETDMIEEAGRRKKERRSVKRDKGNP